MPHGIIAKIIFTWDLKIRTIVQEIQRFAERHERRLHNHVNTEVLQLLDNTILNRRLKRIKPCSA
jgi:hypothetical protein